MEATEFDLIVVGSGAAGLTAALTAAKQGLRVVVLEKTAHFGGTTSLSGGVMWIPNNSLMAQAGIADSPDEAVTYLKHNIGNRVAESKLRSFVEHAPQMLDYLVSHDLLDVTTFDGFPDYRAETPGGKTGGRSVEPKVFPGKRLRDLKNLRRRAIAPPVVGSLTELRNLAEIRSDLGKFLKAWYVVPRSIFGRLLGRQYQASGGGLISWLSHGLEKLGVPVWLETRLEKVTYHDGVVDGVIVLQDDRRVELKARCGVVLAAGGFEHNAALRQAHFGQYGGVNNSSGAPGNEGDVLSAVAGLDVALDLMDDAWWAPTCLIPNKGPQIVIFERGKPGLIIVSQEGKRYANEAQPYADMVRSMFDADRSGLTSLPSFMIFDQRYRDQYPLADMMPGITPSSHLDNGFVKRADSIEALAEQTGIDAITLQATIQRYNEMAKNGVDEDFQRGETAFDRFSGDNAVEPNNCLAPIEQPPFYCVELHAGDLGTRGGLLTNETAQVVNQSGEVIPGLYAAGNCSACVMGNFYPGAGGTIGPAMTWGYLAAMHASAQPLPVPPEP